MGHGFKIDFDAGSRRRALSQQAFRDFGAGITGAGRAIGNAKFAQSERDQQNLIFKLLTENRREDAETAFGRDKELAELRSKLLLDRQKAQRPLGFDLGEFGAPEQQTIQSIADRRQLFQDVPTLDFMFGRSAARTKAQEEQQLGGLQTEQGKSRAALISHRNRQATRIEDQGVQDEAFRRERFDFDQKKFKETQDLLLEKEKRFVAAQKDRERNTTSLIAAREKNGALIDVRIQNFRNKPTEDLRKELLSDLRFVRQRKAQARQAGARATDELGLQEATSLNNLAEFWFRKETEIMDTLKGVRRPAITSPTSGATPAAGVQAPPLSDKNKIRRGIPAFRQFQQAVDAGAEADPAGAESARGIFDRRRSGNEVNFTREYMLAAAKEIRAGKAPVEVAHIIGSRIGIDAFPVQDSDGIAYFLAALGHEQLVKQGVTKFSIQDILGPVKRELMGR